MTPQEIKQMQDTIASLQADVDKLKKNPYVIDHRHTGFDSSKVKFSDLDTVYYKNTTINPSNLADGAGETIQVTGVTGATLGDWVLVSAPYDLQDITVTAYVQATSVVEIRIQNESGGAVDLASGTWRILIIKKIV